MGDLFDKVYEWTKKIPKGKVATYGEIARVVGTKDSRKVGFALHANKSTSVPCHRVVNKVGRLAPNFAFDGAQEQHKRLLDEGVIFKDEMTVDLKKCNYFFKV